jgi:DNA damage-inducible protein 1
MLTFVLRWTTVFGRVHMLYLDVEVNGHKVKALVDSGAQATIMSPSCAEACGIMRLVDKRFAGVAKGVGTANIIGRVHAAPIKIGPLFLACSFTVMEGKSVELLLGLDMLKRFQAVIDLGKDSLRIQGEEVPFLGEAEIPRETEEALNLEPTVPGPAGTRIGQRSGAVVTPAEAAGGAGTGMGATSAAALASASASATPGRSAAASASAGQGGRVPASASAQATPSFPEADINTLMSLGHTRQSAISALEATGGDVEYAASLLFQQ